MAPRLFSREALLAFLAAVCASMVFWPGHWFAGRSSYPTDLILAQEPWRSELPDLARERPHNRELGDPCFRYFPQLAELVRGIHEEGEVPLWNAGIYRGVPLAGNPEVTPADPWHLALALFQRGGEPFSPWRLARGLSWLGILRFVLLAGFAYLWLRRVGGRRPVAALAALVCARGAYASVWWWSTPGHVLVPIPAVLFFVEGSLRGGPKRGLGAAALMLGLSNLGGQPQTSLFFALFLALYVFLRTSREAPAERRAALGRLVLVGVAGALIALPSWLPFFAYLGETNLPAAREALGLLPAGVGWGGLALGGLGALALAIGGWHLWRRLGPGAGASALGLCLGGAMLVAELGGADGQAAFWLLPNLAGHPVQAFPFETALTHAYTELDQDCVGLLVALLLCAGRGAALGALRVVLALLLLAVAHFPVLHQGLRALLPLLEATRGSCTVPLFCAFGLVLALESLAAMPACERGARITRAARGLCAFLLPLLVARALSGELRVGIPDTLALGLVLACALRALPLVPIACAATLLALQPGYAFEPSLTRAEVWPSTPTIELLRAEAARDPDLVVFAPESELLHPNALNVYGIRQSLGFDGFDPSHYLELVLFLPPVAKADRRDLWQSSEMKLDSPLFDLIGGRILVARAGQALPDDFRILRETETLVVAENPEAVPRVFTVTRALDWDRDMTALLAGSATEAVGLVEGEGARVDEAKARAGSARVVERGANALLVEVESEGPCYAVVADNLLEGWRVTIDDEPTTILRADGALRGVLVGAGRHRVRFAYDPPAFFAGWIAAGVGLLLAVLLALDGLPLRAGAPR